MIESAGGTIVVDDEVEDTDVVEAVRLGVSDAVAAT